MRFAGAKQAGLTEDAVAQIEDDYEASGLDESAKVVLRFTDAFLTDPAGIPESLQDQLRAHFSPAQVVELALILGAFAGFSKLRIALGLVPESMATTIVDTPTAPPADEELQPNGRTAMQS